MLIDAPEREYRTWVIDSRRWRHYRPRADDIVIATYPKCGTTWMQRIVSLLIFQTTEPMPIMRISAWIDRRFGDPIEAVLAQIEAQEHRRFLKSHLPLDGLPYYGEVKYIHVARDGRDACISFHNHATSYTDQALERFDKIGLEDETIGRPFPRAPADPADFFHAWVHAGVSDRPFFDFERSWWVAREQPNVLLVHYNDMQQDLSGEMRRIAEFLGIEVAPDLWPELVAAANFEAMRRDGDKLLPAAADVFQGGSQRFLFKGRNERWRGVFRDEDLSVYDAKVQGLLSPACAHWVAHGRLGTGAAVAVN